MIWKLLCHNCTKMLHSCSFYMEILVTNHQTGARPWVSTTVTNMQCCRHWRYHSMALSFLRDLVHPDVAYPARIVRYFLHTLVHDSLELRKVLNDDAWFWGGVAFGWKCFYSRLFSDSYPQHSVFAQTAKTCPQEDFYRSIELLRGWEKEGPWRPCWQQLGAVL